MAFDRHSDNSGDSQFIKISNVDAHGSYISAIDGLRAFAVLSVMAYHLKSEFLLGGFVGVDVFFVISGYVVANSIIRRHFVSFKEVVLYFYARRFLRIMPALIVMLLIASMATIAFVPDAWLSQSNRNTAFFAFFGLSNVRLALSADDDYFGPRTDFNPFAHTWSLGVEEQFYLVFPFIIGAALLFPAYKRAVVWSALILSLLSLGTSAVLTSRHPVFSFFQIPSRFWELGIGLLLALTSISWRPRFDRAGIVFLNVLGACFLVLLTFSFVFCDETHFPFPWAIPPVMATAGLLMVVNCNHRTTVSSILSMRWLSFIGLLSYSLYLWHWPVYVLMRWTTGLESLSEQLTALLVTFLVATASYFMVELPVRYSKRVSTLPRAAVVALFCFATISAAALSREAFKLQNHISLSVTSHDDSWSNAPPANVGCVLFLNDNEIRSDAPFACKAASGRQMLVAGDSHAAAYARMLAQFSNDQDMPVAIYSSPGCAFMNFRDPMRRLERKCALFGEATRKNLLARANSRTIVFLPSLRIDRLRDQWGGFNAPMPQVSDEAADEARTLIEQLSNRGSIVVMEAPTPVFWSPPFRCADWFNRNNPICRRGFVTSRGEFDARRANVLDLERSFSRTIKRVMIWDVEPTLCSASSCSASENGKPLFYDGDHLSGYGNDVLYPVFRRELIQFQDSIFSAGG